MNQESSPSISVRRRKNAVDAYDVQVPAGKSADIPTDDGPVKFSESVIEVEHTLKNEKAEMLKFMEEPVDIMVHESTDPNAVKVIPLAINGVNQPIIRGVVMKVRRKYVALLASLRDTAYTQKTVQTPDGGVTQRMIPNTALRFPFSVVHDDNPRGPSWLKSVLNSN